MKLKGLSLFSNVGIAELLLCKLDAEILLANELIANRAKFYKKIYPKTLMICGDITKSKIKNELIKESINKKINFIMATPPCQGMSTAGKKNNHNDPRNLLITHTIDIIKKIKPMFIFFENVPGQHKTYIKIEKNKILIPEFLEKKLSNNYIFNENRIFNMERYGIPQKRKRSIFLLIRKDLGFKWEIKQPDQLKYKTLKDVIGDLPSLDPFIYDVPYKKQISIFPSYEKKLKKGRDISKWHIPPKHPYRQVMTMLNTPSGKSAFSNQNPNFRPKKIDGSFVKGFKNTYKRQSWNEPGYTITTYNRTIGSQENVHPGRLYKKGNKKLYSDPRVLTILEIMRVMTIPDNWKIPSWCSESFIRQVIGEGIPPLMVYIIFKRLLTLLNNKKNK